MATAEVAFLSDRALMETLRLACRASGLAPVDIVARKWNTFSSSFPSEIVTFAFSDGRERTLLCKFDDDGVEYSARSHRRNLLYEAEVYRDVLQPLGLGAPHYYGHARHEECGVLVLFAEYISNSFEAHHVVDGLIRAAAYAGRFHAVTESILRAGRRFSVTSHDARYYSRCTALAPWLEQISPGCRPWLEHLQPRFVRLAAELSGAHPTLIHGEYYLCNVLIRDTDLWVVDWQSAAAGFGEIDLAAVTEGRWSAEQLNAAVAEYQRARWGGAPDGDFSLRMSVGRMYWGLRLISSNTPRKHDVVKYYLGRIRSEGEKLGLL